MTKFRLNVQRDVDPDGYGGLMLHLPFGFRFDDDLVHVRGYDSMAELKESAKRDVIPCDCAECKAHLKMG